MNITPAQSETCKVKPGLVTTYLQRPQFKGPILDFNYRSATKSFCHYDNNNNEGKRNIKIHYVEASCGDDEY